MLNFDGLAGPSTRRGAWAGDRNRAGGLAQGVVVVLGRLTKQTFDEAALQPPTATLGPWWPPAMPSLTLAKRSLGVAGVVVVEPARGAGGRLAWRVVTTVMEPRHRPEGVGRG